MSDISFKIPSHTQFIGLGIHAFDRVGLEQYIKPYEILALRNDPLVPHHTIKTKPTTLRTSDLIETQPCQEILKDYQQRFEKVYCLLNKNSPEAEVAAKKLGIHLIANSANLQHQFENKAQFRQQFASRLPIPKFLILPTTVLINTPYKTLRNKFGNFVIQDETLSGGKGTWRIKTEAQFINALAILKTLTTKHVIVSQYIHGPEASIQACIAKDETFTTRLQTQIVGEPSLVNTQKPHANQFAGGQWSGNQYQDALQEQAQKIVATIASDLKAAGYKGIFGVDFIIDTGDNLYVTEVNARLTGLTPIHLMLQKKHHCIPMILLHVLELAHIPYTLTDPEALNEQYKGVASLSYALLHNRTSSPLILNQPLQSGLHTQRADGLLTFIKPTYDIKEMTKENQMILIEVPSTSEKILSSNRLMRLISQKPFFDNQHLTPIAQKTVDWIENQFVEVSTK